MPTVPVLQPQVREAALPSSNIGTARGSAPSGASPVGDALQRTGQTVFAIEDQRRKEAEQIAEQARRRADQVEVMRAENDLSQVYSRLETQITRTQGKDAAGLPDLIPTDYDAASQTIRDSLSNDDQRFAFDQAVAQRRGAIGQFMNRHVAGEMERYDKQETDAAVRRLTEDASRNFQDPKAAQAVFGQLDATIDRYAETYGMGPEWSEKQKRDAHSAAYRNMFDRYTASKDYSGAEKFLSKHRDSMTADDVSRGELMITNYKIQQEQRAEIAERRRIAQAEHRMRVAEASFRAGQDMLDRGLVLSPEFAASTASKLAGTHYAQLWESYTKDGAANVRFSSMPLPQQQSTLDALVRQGNEQGWTPERRKQYDKLVDLKNKTQKEYTDDPLRAAVDRGVLTEIPQINTASADSIAAGLGPRVASAQQVQQMTGRPVSPLTSDEAADLGTKLSVMPPGDRARALSKLTRDLPPAQRAALARQLGAKDKAMELAIGFAGQGTVSGSITGRSVSEMILTGATVIAEKRVAQKEVAQARQDILEQLDGVYPSEEARQNAVEAALLIRFAGETDTARQPNIKTAVTLATGGIYEGEGWKVPMPYGMQQDDFRNRLRTVQPTDLDNVSDGRVYSAGGVSIPVDEFLEKVPDAHLVSAGKGRYAVRSGNGLLVGATGKPVIVRIRN